jgi:D-alanyl-D-alanine carboxypeptidase
MVAAAVVAGCVTGAGAVAAPAGATPTPHAGYGQADLQRDLEALRAIGATGALAEVDLGRRRIGGHAGVADVESGRPVNERGYFRIGSNTKTFVAVVLVQLAGEGRLSLDDTVERWLPGVVAGNGNDGRAVTVRQLLQHTSGVYDYTADLAGLFTSPEAFNQHRFDHLTPGALVAMAMRHPPVFAPGSSWDYSNTNYVLAGMVIQKITGRTWWQEVRSRVTVPLGLRHTFYPADRLDLPRPHAQGYLAFGPDGPLVDATAINSSWADAAGGLVSTAADLTRFWQALQGGELLRRADLAQLERTVLATTLQDVAPGGRYGLGIMWLPLSCGSGYWSHYGDIPGYATGNGVTPDARRSVVVSVSTDLNSAQGFQQQAALVDHALCARTT